MDTRDKLIAGEKKKANFFLYAFLIVIIFILGYVVRADLEKGTIKTRKEPIDSFSELRAKIRHRYVRMDNGVWLYVHAVYEDGKFSYSDNMSNFGYAPINRIVAVSDIPQGSPFTQN